jgi:lipopolysaccharide export system protein LptA
MHRSNTGLSVRASWLALRALGTGGMGLLTLTSGSALSNTFSGPSAPQPLPVQPQPVQAAAPTPARVRTGLVTIESDLQRADQSTGVITATGNVRIVYPDQRVVATARQAQYFSREGRVVLSGDVDIAQEGGNLLRAEQVVYLVERDRLVAIPSAGQQVYSRVSLPARQRPVQP